MNVLELSEQEIIRRNSLNEMRAMGIDPYPAAEYVTNAFSTDIKAEFKEDETEPRKVSVANSGATAGTSRLWQPTIILSSLRIVAVYLDSAWNGWNKLAVTMEVNA